MDTKYACYALIGISLVTLVMVVKMASALTALQAQANTTVEGVKAGPLGGLLHGFGVV